MSTPEKSVFGVPLPALKSDTSAICLRLSISEPRASVFDTEVSVSELQHPTSMLETSNFYTDACVSEVQASAFYMGVSVFELPFLTSKMETRMFYTRTPGSEVQTRILKVPSSSRSLYELAPSYQTLRQAIIPFQKIPQGP